jgi:hypothetical protein
VNLHHGRIEEATVKPILAFGSTRKSQVDFGHDQTRLIDTRQVVE